MDTTALLRAHRVARRVPFGRTVLSGVIRTVAPYFLTIPATLDVMEPGRAVAHMHHRPWVRNHLGTVHAIALCNLAELTMGMAVEATIPPTHRWIPQEMTVRYLHKAMGTVTATCEVDLPPLGDEGTAIPIEVRVTDGAGTLVFTATIELWVTPKPRRTRG